MNLIGQPIKHRTFGPGIVTDLSEGTVTICFQNSEKKFIFPDAFRGFLLLKDQKTQRHIEKLIKDRDRAEQKARQDGQAEQERRNRLLNFKVTATSHAVFHIAQDQIHQVIKMGRVSTGTYLSGDSRGKPRVADRMKPHSVCLLTTRPAGENEQERAILGAFMVREDFFGEDAPDGIIEGHPQHRIILSKSSQPSFWKYFGENTPPRWGNTAFKYCSEGVVNRMLADLAESLTSSEQARTAMDFYRYFCKKNQLRPLIKLEEDNAGEAQ